MTCSNCGKQSVETYIFTENGKEPLCTNCFDVKYLAHLTGKAEDAVRVLLTSYMG